MNKSPEHDDLPEHDDVMIRRLLQESGVDESPELLEGLQVLRSYAGTPAPVPTGELAELLSDTAEPEPLHRRPQRRNRGLILSFTLAAAMAAGATGVAANTGTDLRLTGESVSAEILEPVSAPESTAGEDEPADAPAPAEGNPAPANEEPAAPSPADPAAPEDAAVPADSGEAAGAAAGPDDGASVPPVAAGPEAAGPEPAVDPECDDDDGAPGTPVAPVRPGAAGDGNGNGPGNRQGPDRSGPDGNGPGNGSGQNGPGQNGPGQNGTGENGPKQNGPGRNGVHPEGSRGPEREGNTPGET